MTVIEKMQSVAVSQDNLLFEQVLETGCQLQIRRIKCSFCDFKVIGKNNFWTLVEAFARHLNLDDKGKLRQTKHEGFALCSKTI